MFFYNLGVRYPEYFPLVCTENKWLAPVILALGRQRKEHGESETRVGHTAMSETHVGHRVIFWKAHVDHASMVYVSHREI